MIPGLVAGIGQWFNLTFKIMAANKSEDSEKLITETDLENLQGVFSLAIIGAGTNRENLKNTLMYEDILIGKFKLTLKVIKEKAKAK